MTKGDNTDKAGKKAGKKGKKGKKWIQGMHLKKGALHRALGVPQGQTIPAAKMQKALKSGGKVARMARVAQTLKGMNKG